MLFRSSNLDNADLNGVWTLKITDNVAQDDGVLNNWSLTFPAACFGNLGTITPKLNTATWVSATNGAPPVPPHNSVNTVVPNPSGSAACPTSANCTGNKLTNSVTIGPFNTTGVFDYTLEVVDEFNCTYNQKVTVNVTGFCCINPITPTFNSIAPICSGENFSLPTSSNNGITGTWSPAINNTATTT